MNPEIIDLGIYLKNFPSPKTPKNNWIKPTIIPRITRSLIYSGVKGRTLWERTLKTKIDIIETGPTFK